MEMTSITAAYNGLKIAKNIFTDLNDLKIETATLDKINEAVKKVAEAQDALFILREELFKLQDENNSLKRELDDIETWDNKISQYTLTKTNGGSVVYKYNSEPLHYACPSCATKQELQFLQEEGGYSGASICPNSNCNGRYQIEPDKDMSPLNFDNRYV